MGVSRLTVPLRKKKGATRLGAHVPYIRDEPVRSGLKNNPVQKETVRSGPKTNPVQKIRSVRVQKKIRSKTSVSSGPK